MERKSHNHQITTMAMAVEVAAVVETSNCTHYIAVLVGKWWQRHRCPLLVPNPVTSKMFCSKVSITCISTPVALSPITKLIPAWDACRGHANDFPHAPPATSFFTDCCLNWLKMYSTGGDHQQYLFLSHIVLQKSMCRTVLGCSQQLQNWTRTICPCVRPCHKWLLLNMTK